MFNWRTANNLFLIFLTSFAFGQDRELKFRHFKPDDGMFSGNVRAFAQDRQGFLWIGTEEGLFRYDGYEMVPIRKEKDNPASLNVMSIQEDLNENLWVGTFNAGLFVYDRKKNALQNYHHIEDDPTSLPDNLVRVVYVDGSKNLFVGSNDLSYFNLGDIKLDGSVAFHKVAIPRSTNKPNWVSGLRKTPDGKLWVATRSSGAFIFDVNHPEVGLGKAPFAEENLQNIFTDSKKRTWIGTWDGGVGIYDSTLKRHSTFSANGSPSSIGHNLVTQVGEDHEGNIWIATDNGLSKFASNKDPFSSQGVVTYVHDRFLDYSLLSNAIKGLYFDRDNRMWVGSYFGGINVYDPNLPEFNAYKPNINEKNGLSNGNVTAFALDKTGQLWIGSDGGGLYVLRPENGKFGFRNFKKIELVNPITHTIVDKIKCLAVDDIGHIWIGTWAGGLFKLNPVSLKLEHFGAAEKGKYQLPSNDVLSLQTEGNNVWVGFFDAGLSYYEPVSGAFKNFKGESGRIERVNAIQLTNTPNTVIIANDQGGLRIYNSQTGYQSIYKNELLKDLPVQTFFYSDSNLWVGASAMGLIQFTPETGKVKVYNNRNGLTNYIINAIRKDKQGRIWISTNQGLFRLDEKEERFYRYGMTDGLQGSRYNRNSSFVLGDGLMLFGGTNGFDYFYPEEIKLRTSASNVIFTKFWLRDREVNVLDSLSPLKESVLVAKELDLKHFQNSFSLEFASLDFTYAKSVRYQYLAEGIFDSWQNLGTSRKITFTDLEPGTYKIKVRASQSELEWPDKVSQITIHIQAAWWQTNWARLGLVGILLATGFGVHRFRTKYLHLQKKALERQVEERTKQLGRLNSEILAQNEELISQNDSIMSHREELEATQGELKSLNQNLEQLVEIRTEKLQDVITKLDKALKELDRFVYSASHELGAPLKSIVGLINLAKLENDPLAVARYHQYIEASIVRLDQVIKNLVDFSRNEHLEIRNETIVLSELVTDISNEIQFWPEAKDVSIINEVPAGFVLLSDASRIKIVLYNLVSNSIKYADSKKTDSFVKISASKTEGCCVLTIADNGIGIKPGHEEKIFDMFFRAHEQSTGSGLGLFIVKEIISTLNGSISCKANVLDGTLFEILIMDKYGQPSIQTG